MSASPETPTAETPTAETRTAEAPARAPDEERLARLALTVLAEPGSAQVSRLVQQLGARPLLAHLLADQELSGLRDDVQQRLVTVDPERVLRQGERLGLRYVVPGDDEWPAGLDDLYAAPVVEERGGPPLGPWHKRHNRLIAAHRAQVEGVFATLKRWLGLASVRYRGLARNNSHLLIAATAYNMKRMLKLA